MKWTFPSLKLDMAIVADRGDSQNYNRMANNVDPDETAHLHCLHRYLVLVCRAERVAVGVTWYRSVIEPSTGLCPKMGRVKRNSAFEHAQNVRLYISLYSRKVSYGHLLSIALYSI